MSDFAQVGKVVADYLKLQLVAEFKAQGHNLTGALVSSIEARIEAQAGGFVITFLANNYGVIVNNGVPASRIPYDPTVRTGRRTSQYIQALIAYVQRRMGLRGREATGVAFAIARKHAREGMPTAGSYRFSSNSRRAGWIDAVVDNEEKVIEAAVLDWMEKQISALFEKAYTK